MGGVSGGEDETVNIGRGGEEAVDSGDALDAALDFPDDQDAEVEIVFAERVEPITHRRVAAIAFAELGFGNDQRLPCRSFRSSSPWFCAANSPKDPRTQSLHASSWTKHSLWALFVANHGERVGIPLAS